MRDSGWVNNEKDAERMGNGMMDAGLLHHVTHAQPFQNSHLFYHFHESFNATPYIMPLR